MKSALSRILVINLALTVNAGLAWGKPAADELYLTVTIVTGEHSRDSNSTTTTLTVDGDTLAYEESHHGAHSRRAPVKKEYRLSRKDRDELLGLLKEKNLLITRTVTATVTPLSETTNLVHYFELKIRSRLDGKEHSISIDGPRSAEKVKKEAVYQHSVYLLAHLYGIINRTDPDITLPQLID
jgi:hypothetical protein